MVKRGTIVVSVRVRYVIIVLLLLMTGVSACNVVMDRGSSGWAALGGYRLFSHLGSKA